MIIIDKTTNKQHEITAGSDGYLYYNGKDFSSNTIDMMTTTELAKLNIQSDGAGRRFIQKGGQKKLYIDDAILTDYNSMKVSTYLQTAHTYVVTVTLKYTVAAPNDKFALMKVQDSVDSVLCTNKHTQNYSATYKANKI